MEKNNYVAVTYTTNGYVDFTHNLLSSVEKNNIDLKIKVFSLDKKASIYFESNGIETTEHNSKYIESQEDMFFQNSDNFGYLMIAKFEIIYKELLKNDYVLYIDGDIVIKKDIIKYLFSVKRNYDIIFQNDKRPSKPNLINLCAGFMFIKSNKKSRFNYGVLSLDMFPNGAHYYKNYNNLDPSIIHFNYVIGDEKIDTIKKHNEWYLDN